MQCLVPKCNRKKNYAESTTEEYWLDDIEQYSRKRASTAEEGFWVVAHRKEGGEKRRLRINHKGVILEEHPYWEDSTIEEETGKLIVQHAEGGDRHILLNNEGEQLVIPEFATTRRSGYSIVADGEAVYVCYFKDMALVTEQIR